jgi:hypothetical protein
MWRIHPEQNIQHRPAPPSSGRPQKVKDSAAQATVDMLIK